MYGLLLDAFGQMVIEQYGMDEWLEMRRQCLSSSELRESPDFDETAVPEEVGPATSCCRGNFGDHRQYRESLLPHLVSTLAGRKCTTTEEIWRRFGSYFLTHCHKHGYRNILLALGHSLRDFLNGLDDLHEYLRFSYPKIRPPSFSVVHEDQSSLTLLYRSRRRGYHAYVQGQIEETAKLIYHQKITIEMGETEQYDGLYCTKLFIVFDNNEFDRAERQSAQNRRLTNDPNLAQMPSLMLLELFPFAFVFGPELLVYANGNSLRKLFKRDIVKEPLSKLFRLRRPLCSLAWPEIVTRLNGTFELELIEQSSKDYRTFFLKGEMRLVPAWNAVVFLGNPNICDISVLLERSMCLNDMSIHDSSRELVLAGTQRTAELIFALKHEREKSEQLEVSMQKLDDEMRRTDQLLYQMIPKPVADKLRRGADAFSTCQHCAEVTILFSDIVGFTDICSLLDPIDVMQMLNSLYTEFDNLTEKYKVYKVETIGDSYMVASGVPDYIENHAVHIAELAQTMIEVTKKQPVFKSHPFNTSPGHENDAKPFEHIQIRLGIHTGPVVAGVVGLKMPRYCLFGDTVNTASRMETHSLPLKIHVSKTTRDQLENHPYIMTYRSTLYIKGKGNMATYWLEGRLENSESIIQQTLNA